MSAAITDCHTAVTIDITTRGVAGVIHPVDPAPAAFALASSVAVADDSA